MNGPHIVPRDSVNGFKFRANHIFLEKRIPNATVLLVLTGIGERHDAQFQILVDSDSLLTGFHVVLVDGRTIEYFKLLVVDKLVDILVTEGGPPPVHENDPHLVQKGL